MSFRTFRRTRVPAVSLSTALATLFAIAAVAGPNSAGPSSTCPSINALGNFLAASNVAASISNNGNITTYRFLSLTNENPVNGVPGLIKYCVYPTSDTPPTAVVAQASGANGEAWTSRVGSPDFSFGRPHGNPSNIPLDGTTTVMGTATWSALPSDQTVLLHINDPAVCANLYGDSSDTCFVKPSLALACDQGDTTAAYNALCLDPVNCSKPSLGFEATATNEFGDEVGLAGTARELVSLSVLFSSYGCGDSGHWYLGVTSPCVTTPGATFDVPITANIYAGDTCITAGCTPGALLATVTQTFTIPYRPSADPTNCPDAVSGAEADSQWFNPLKDGGVGGCQFSISKLLTFTFPTGIMLPDNVIWTVAFDTTHSGYTPIGESTTCFTTNSNNPGCGYDSLNVGVRSFPGAPYAGTDVSEDVAFMSWYLGGYPSPYGSGTLQSLESTTGWTTLRPLGEIITK